MMTTALPGPNIEPRHLTRIVAALVVARFLFHVVYIPLFEGPDEPFHLSRTLDLSSRELAPHIVGAIRAHPCGADLQRAFGCPPFRGDGAFNIVGPRASRSPESGIENYEAHQPPLYYFLAGLPYRILGGDDWSAERQLLAVRLFSVGVVIAALVGFVVQQRGMLWFVMPLLLPGAAEALARAANDALLFAWAVIAWLAAERKNLLVILLAALGPLIKLTAFPIVAATVVLLWFDSRRGLAVATALTSLLVFPLQALRGWAWGGTLEINLASGGIDESWSGIALGLARSVYTFLKTTFWLGEWSFFRSPAWLIAFFFLLLGGFFLTTRCVRTERSRWLAHGTGLVVAVTGFFTFAVFHRKLFGTWGGIGGWYFWGWYPWLAVAVADVTTSTPRAPIVRSAFVVFIVAANIAWFAHAIRLYGI